MAKSRTQYVCQDCGASSPQYFGKCPSCNAWNTLVEQVIAPTTSTTDGARLVSRKPTQQKKSLAVPQAIAALTLSQIADHPTQRFSSGYIELDRVLGGGIVPGSLVLVGGDPGIGKSTLLLQIVNQLSHQQRVLYVCAEESGQQVKLRAQRLGVQPILNSNAPSPDPSNSELRWRSSSEGGTPNPELYLLPETDLETILQELDALKPQVAVIDSIQALYFSALTSSPGSVAQVRECTSALMRLAKQENIMLFIVGHVTKEGAIAGPKVLEHLVDTVLYFEGERFANHRLLRSVKNRFGATHELGVFEMLDRGLREVPNPSELFLGDRDEVAPGTATIVACEGTRPIVVELQALVSPTSYSSPRRSTTGLEYNRLLQILAVLEKRLGIPLSKLDAYVASSGGLNVAEPAADLGVAIAVAASFRDRLVDPLTVIIGEVGLGGQVRSVSQMELRLKEALKLGFKRAIVPKGQLFPDLEIEMIPVARVADAIVAALKSGPQIDREPHLDPETPADGDRLNS
jgi:DNA repair protein RadA/Sms